MKPLSLGLALLFLNSVAPVASASTATDAERQIMSSINRARADRGLVPLRSDYRLWILADDRAAAMANEGVLSHSVAGSLAATLTSRDIQWYAHGEVIAYTSASRSASPAELFRLWATSPPHWALLTSTRFNYLGIGLAYSSSGLTYGSIVLTESRDRTGARAKGVRASVSGDDIRWTWRGSDPALQTHTAGLRNFLVQQRTDGGEWVTVATSTTITARSARNRAGGHWYGLRVRARDRAGNLGPWSAESRVWVP
ncbi:MAG: CAP domain-containing protein [Candidatus Limnocylindrales bacterium]